LRRTGTRDTTALARPPPRYVLPKARIEPAFSNGTKYPISSPPALSGERAIADWPFGRRFKRCIRRLHHPNEIAKRICRGALDHGAPPKRTHLVRPAIGGPRLLAPFPPAGPALRSAHVSARAPGIRVSRFGFRRNHIRTSHDAENKNPPEPGSGGSIYGLVDRAYARSLPRAGRAPSNGRLPFGRLRRISYPRCMLDSCSVFANHFAKGAVGTPGRFASQHACFT